MAGSILVIGVGNMGGALVHGLKRSEFQSEVTLRVCDQFEDRARELAKELGVSVVGDLSADPLDDTVVALCIKPQDLAPLASILKGRIGKHALVISILAGTPIEDICAQLDWHGAVVRAMPNIPATVGQAATAMCANERIRDEQKVLAEKVFKSVGEAYWTKEALMDAVTGLSGSGPAYIYMVIEALTDGGVKMGLPRTLASNLATQTVLGSAALVKSTGLHPAILKDQVTTPGGTTISAIHELEDHGLRAMLISAVVTATERSATLRLNR